MKKIFAIVAMAVVALFSVNTLKAQMISDVNLEDYAKAKYGTKWMQAAMRVADETKLDQDGSYVITRTIQAPGMKKNDLFYEMADWFICNYQNSIQMADKEDGVIVARPYVSNVASSVSGWNAYKIDICPMVRVKVTDGQVRVTYTLKDYGVAEQTGGGNAAFAVACGVVATAAVAEAATAPREITVVEQHRHGHTTVVRRTYRPHYDYTLADALLISSLADKSAPRYDNDHKVWPITECYPYSGKDSHKRASSKAFVMATTYSQVIMNNIESALNQCQLAYND